MTPDDLALMPAHVALTEFRARRLSPVELTTALIDRAEADQGRINPFTFTYFDAALDAAKRAEASYMGKVHHRARWKACVSRSRMPVILLACPHRLGH